MTQTTPTRIATATPSKSRSRDLRRPIRAYVAGDSLSVSMKLTNRGSYQSQVRPLQLARQRWKLARCFRVALRRPLPMTGADRPLLGLRPLPDNDRQGTQASRDLAYRVGGAQRISTPT